MAEEVLMVEARLKDYISGELGKITDSFKKFSTEAERSTSKATSSTNMLTTGLKALSAAYLSYAGMQKVIAFGEASIQEFIKADEAANRLAASLSYLGKDTDAVVERFKSFAAAMQAQTRYEDDAIVSQMAYAKNLGISANQLEAATKAAIGLAAKYRLDLQSAMMLVGRASQGQTQMLSRYGIVMKETMTPQEKFNELLKIGGEAFGLAEKDARSYAGQLDQLKNRFSDLQEEVGKTVIPLKIMAEQLKLSALNLVLGDWDGAVAAFKGMSKEELQHNELIMERNNLTVRSMQLQSKSKEMSIEDFRIYNAMQNRIKEIGSKLGEGKKETAIPEEVKKGVGPSKEEQKAALDSYMEGWDDWLDSAQHAGDELTDVEKTQTDERLKNQEKFLAEFDLRQRLKQKALLDGYEQMNEDADAFDKKLLKQEQELDQFMRPLYSGLGAGLGRALADGFKGEEVNMGNVFKSVLATALPMLFQLALPGPLGMLFGGLTGGFFGGLQHGTQFAPGGYALVGEKGPELMRVPRGASVSSAEQTKVTNNTTNNTSQPTVIVVNSSSGNLVRDIESVVRDRSLDLRKLLSMGGVGV